MIPVAHQDPIVALATPYATAALAVIRTSGPGSLELVAALTNRREKILASPGGRLRRAELRDPRSGDVLDEVMLGVYRAPASYTGEDMVEIFCHGSPAGIQRVLAVLLREGFRQAEPGEFTQRAFRAGKIDLTRAEAVHEVVAAQTAAAHGMALRRLGGAVEEALNGVKQELVRLMAPLAVQLDYPEEETGEIPVPLEPVEAVRATLQTLADSYRTGRLYREGAVVVLAGRPNAGKSSLFNALLREDRAIVSPIPGTTRDYIESPLDIAGIPFRVYDTAGVRRAGEVIEEEGIRRTRQMIDAADVVLYLIDSTVGIHRDDREFLQDTGTTSPVLPVWTKTDAPEAAPPPAGFTGVSAHTMEGIGELAAGVTGMVTPETFGETGPVIDSLRQRDLLYRGIEALGHLEEGIRAAMPADVLALDLQEAIHALGEITGEVTSADILDAVFQGFCVGK